MKLFQPYYYDDVKDAFLWFCKKYWPEQEIVCFPNKTPVGWTDKIIEYFKGIKDEYVMLVPEDFFLMEPIQHRIIKTCEDFANKVKADKIELTGVFKDQTEGNPIRFDFCNFSLVRQDAEYRMTLHPSIWRREYWLGLAKSGQHWWKFELCQRALNDGGKIYHVDPAPIINPLNFMWRGKANTKVFQRVKNAEDLAKITELAKKYA